MGIYTPLLKEAPKAKPLAQTLVAAAAEQGARYEELQLACRLALDAYQKAIDPSSVVLSEFESKAQTALERI